MGTFDKFRNRISWQSIGKVLSVGFPIAVLALAIQYLTYSHEMEIFEKTKIPQLAIEYYKEEPFAPLSWPIIKITNYGNKRADSVWIVQKIYLADDASDQVYECDLPRYAYILYNGSRKRMFDLEVDSDTTIRLIPDCYLHYEKLLTDDFPGQIVYKWQVTFTYDNLPKRKIEEEYYLMDISMNPTLPAKIPGGMAIVDRVMSYTQQGPPQRLIYEPSMDKYFVNPPNSIYCDSAGNYRHLTHEVNLPVGAAIINKVPYEVPIIKLGSKGTFYFIWQCSDTLTCSPMSMNGKFCIGLKDGEFLIKQSDHVQLYMSKAAHK